jgi:hypothetical protein
MDLYFNVLVCMRWGDDAAQELTKGADVEAEQSCHREWSLQKLRMENTYRRET